MSVYLLTLAFVLLPLATAVHVTFSVDEVEAATQALPPEEPHKLISDYLHKVVPESSFKYPPSLQPVRVSPKKNLFVGAVHTAYDQHYPLVLSPDMIWQCVAQGFAIHVNKNTEKLRHMFVENEGKTKIIVERNRSYSRGNPDNDWEGVFGDFSEEIRKNVGDEIHSLLTPEFSTTGPVERAAAQIVLMDAFKEYFEYELHTLCGIPQITLEGTVDDWKKLREKTLSLAKFDLKWWIDAMEPILNEFVKAAGGKVCTDFWKHIYKIDGGSGGPYITGWTLTLFPYIGRNMENMRQNPFLESWKVSDVEDDWGYGLTTSSFPKGTVSTPFKWVFPGKEFPMYFYAGFLGVSQDKKSLALRPVIGWAVVDGVDEIKTRSCKNFVHDEWQYIVNGRTCLRKSGVP